MRYYQGNYRPTHPEKYVGDVTSIQYRSSWELRFMRYADTNASILKWASEEIVIPYISPLDNQPHRYFPDFIIQTKDKTYIVEIKPSVQCKEPVFKKGTHKRRMIREVSAWAVNQAKWKAATHYANKKGMQFQIITEQELGI